jgi:hypothetical protein
MNRAILAFLAVAVLLLAPPVVEAKGLKAQKVKGDLTAAEEGSDLKGRFALVTLTSGDRGREKLFVIAKGLDRDSEYEVLLGEDVDGAVSFGEMKVRGRRGIGRFRFSSRKHDYPDGVDSLLDFSGEKIFVVSGDETVLSGDIPGFAGLTDDEVDEGAFAFGFGKEKLAPPEDVDSLARGLLLAAAVNTSQGSREWMGVIVFLLDRGEEYDVVLVGEDGADDVELGTVEPRGFFGFAKLTLEGDDLPDHPANLEGRTLEVRDSDGEVALTGTVPALE